MRVLTFVSGTGCSAPWMLRRVSLVPAAFLVLAMALLPACDQEPEFDAVPPESVTDLAVTSAATTSLVLGWTAPGDDGAEGRAARYDIRYSAVELNEATWDSATALEDVPAPSSPGAAERVVIRGLTPGTVYRVALKSGDESCNWSELSNVASDTTFTEDVWLKVPWVSDSDGEWSKSAYSMTAEWGSAVGASRYECAVGSQPGATDVGGWASVGNQTWAARTGLSLSHGVKYYFGVRAAAGPALGPEAWSDGITVDVHPPESRVTDLPAEVNALTFTVSCSGSDDLSGISLYSTRYKDGLAGSWHIVQPPRPETTVQFTGANGHTYCFASSATDSAGNVEPYPEVADAQTTILLLDVPAIAWVDDGLAGDLDWTNSTSQLSANWSSATGADGYEYAVGQAPGGSSIVGWTPVGGVTVVSIDGLQLAHGRSYYFSVRAVIGSRRGSQTSSDGITVDTYSPTSYVSTLADHTLDLGIDVYWQGSDDLSRGLKFDVEVRDGSGGEWEDWIIGASAGYTRFFGADGHTYCFRSRARDLAGNQEEYPATADACTDFTLVVPIVEWVNDGLSADEQWTNKATELSANWKAAAGVDGYEYALRTSPGGPLDICDWTSADSGTRVTKSGLALSHGTTYYASVRAVFGSARGTARTSDGITVDTEIPASHVVALPDTIHSADFDLEWVGTDDLSGVASFDVQYRVGETGSWITWIAATRGTSFEFGGGPGYTYYFRSRARDRAGNVEPYPEVADAVTFVKGDIYPPDGPKFALHLVPHGLAGCSKRPVVAGVEDLARYWPGLGVDLDAFMVIFDYGELSVYEYSLTWPSMWGSCSTIVCEGVGCVGQLYNPGDPGIACFTDGCTTETDGPFLVVAYHWFLPTAPGEISITSNLATGNLGVVDCAPDDRKAEHFARWIYCAGVQVDPYEGPTTCCPGDAGWSRLKELFR